MITPSPIIWGRSAERCVAWAVLWTVWIATASPAVGATVHVLPYDGAITPVSAEYLIEGIAAAEAAGAEAVLIELDTPGGLDTAMRDIVKAELGATIPVIVYVAPSGSRAASAGAYITMAAHIAAMAPGTNIGSASPVSMGGAAMDSTMARKVMHDSVAYLESIASQRGRSVEMARRFVEDAHNLPAQEAMRENVVDLIADSRRDLLRAVDGWEVELGDGAVVLATAEAEVDVRPMTTRQRILKTLANPNVAYILLLLGMYGLFFELSNPGSLAPGIIGGICILLAMFAFQNLPINYTGIALMVLGVIMLVLEVKVTSFGALTIGGLTAMVLGSVMLFDSPADWARVSLRLIIPAVVAFASFFVLCVWLVVRSQRRALVTGMGAMVGATGRVVVALPASGPGKVVLHGEFWDAEAEEAIEAGATVELLGIDGRVARVRRHPARTNEPTT